MSVRSIHLVEYLAMSVAAIVLVNSSVLAQAPLNLTPRSGLSESAPPAKPVRVPEVMSAPSSQKSVDGALAGQPDKRLNQLDRAIDAAKERRQTLQNKAQILDADIQNLRQNMIAAAQLIQTHESRVTELEQQLREVNKTVVIKQKNLRHDRKQLGRVIQALQRVAQYPPEALIVRPISPGDAVRSAILLRSAVPELERRAIILRDDIDALRQSRSEAAQRKTELSSASAELENQRAFLRTLIGRKSRLRRRTLAKSVQAQREVRSLAKQARSIRDLMARLEKLRIRREQEARAQERAKANNQRAASGEPDLKRPAAFTGRLMETARGRLPYPVRGQVIARFGDREKGGLTHKGLTFETTGGAQVIAPYEGRVAFSGPFRGYGELLIIEHREGYHTLLAGMSRIDGTVGQWLLAGEPVGIMGRAPAGETKVRPTLYMELRYKGQPINPLPWLASRKG